MIIRRHLYSDQLAHYNKKWLLILLAVDVEAWVTYNIDVIAVFLAPWANYNMDSAEIHFPLVGNTFLNDTQFITGCHYF